MGLRKLMGNMKLPKWVENSLLVWGSLGFFDKAFINSSRLHKQNLHHGVKGRWHF